MATKSGLAIHRTRRRDGALSWLRAGLCAAALAVGCESDGGGGEGTLAVEIWGEDFIEAGIPAGEFADGFGVTFERFLVVVSDVSAARGAGTPDVSDPTARVFDLTREGPFPLLTRPVPAGRYDHTNYRIAPATADTTAGNATAADLDEMRAGGLSVLVAGTASDGPVTKHFAWAFTTDTRYVHCASLADVAAGGAATVQLTIHGDHLFYDDLFSETPSLRFAELAAADADNDGEVTQAELAAHDITALANYGTGSEDIAELGSFVAFLTRTLGHIDGEGHCGVE